MHVLYNIILLYYIIIYIIAYGYYNDRAPSLWLDDATNACTNIMNVVVVIRAMREDESKGSCDSSSIPLRLKRNKWILITVGAFLTVIIDYNTST